MPRALDAQTALDRYFLETRGKLIEIAANLDRIAEAPGADAAARDRRMAQIRQALELLAAPGADKASRCQMIFSVAYEEGWQK